MELDYLKSQASLPQDEGSGKDMGTKLKGQWPQDEGSVKDALTSSHTDDCKMKAVARIRG